MDSAYIKCTETVDTGGNVQVDLITLHSGAVLAVSADCATLYPLGAVDFWRHMEGHDDVQCTTIY